MNELMIKVISLDNEINELCNIINNYRFTIKELEHFSVELSARIKERDYLLTIIRGMVEL